MSYFPSIPNGNDPRAESQGQILSNFQTINSVWAVNHSNLTGTATQGQHDVLTIRTQTGDPTTTANQVALYNKLDSNNIPELFFRPKSNGAPIQMTLPTVKITSSTTPTTTAFDQVSFVAGPFIIYQGFRTDSSPMGIANNFPITLSPSCSTLIYANVNQLKGATGPNAAPAVIATSLSGTGFNVSRSSIGTGILKAVYYFAIGKP